MAARKLVELLRGRGSGGEPRGLELATDPELILHAYDAWGVECLHNLLGDFCFALWDGPRKRLVCAVDHFGVKPFFYAHVGNAFVFGNSLDCVRLHPLVTDRLDEIAVGDFLLVGYYQDRGVTIDADVRRLPPAHVLVVEGGASRTTSYWRLPEVPELRLARPAEYVERFEQLLDLSVRDRLRTRRVSISLSGGLDSPLVAARASRILKQKYASFELTGFTVVFDHLIPDEERRYASLAGAHLGIPIRFQAADDVDAGDWTRRPEWFPPEPSVGLLQGSWLDQMHDVQSAGPVHLTGYDGDALLLSSIRLYWKECIRDGRWVGLARDLLWYVATQRGLPPIGVRTGLANLRRRSLPPRFPEWFNEAFEKRARLAERFREANRREQESTSRSASRINLEFPLWGLVFDSFDPAWSHCAVDVRHPLLDLRLVSFARSLPAVPWCVGKEILRRCLRDFPTEVRSRPKTPLRADPVVAKLRKGGRLGIESSALSPELGEFVNVRKVPLPSRDSDTASIYFGLRAMILKSWLEGRRGR